MGPKVSHSNVFGPVLAGHTFITVTVVQGVTATNRQNKQHPSLNITNMLLLPAIKAS